MSCSYMCDVFIQWQGCLVVICKMSLYSGRDVLLYVCLYTVAGMSCSYMYVFIQWQGCLVVIFMMSLYSGRDVL